MEGLQRRGERQHRLVRLGAQRGQLVAQQPEVAELGHGHAGQGGPVRERRSQRRVFGQPEVRVQFGVSQQAEQVNDAVPGEAARLARIARLAGLAELAALAGLAELAALAVLA